MELVRRGKGRAPFCLPDSPGFNRLKPLSLSLSLFAPLFPSLGLERNLSRIVLPKLFIPTLEKVKADYARNGRTKVGILAVAAQRDGFSPVAGILNYSKIFIAEF